jgi:hypothetical protein
MIILRASIAEHEPRQQVAWQHFRKSAPESVSSATLADHHAVAGCRRAAPPPGAAEGRLRADLTTLESVTDAWARYSRTTRTLAEKHIIQGLGARKLRDLSAEDVDKWLAE